MGSWKIHKASFDDDGESRLGRSQVPGLGGLGYHHFRVIIEGGVRADGDYYGDSSAQMTGGITSLPPIAVGHGKRFAPLKISSRLAALPHTYGSSRAGVIIKSASGSGQGLPFLVILSSLGSMCSTNCLQRRG